MARFRVDSIASILVERRRRLPLEYLPDRHTDFQRVTEMDPSNYQQESQHGWLA